MLSGTNAVINKLFELGYEIDKSITSDIYKEFKKYAEQIVKNAQVLGEELKKQGFKLVTGGTDSHLLLVDLRNKGIDGKTAAEKLEEEGIITNANSIPNDPASALRPSGLRLGTAAVTTKGMKEKEMKELAEKIAKILL